LITSTVRTTQFCTNHKHKAEVHVTGATSISNMVCIH